MVTRRVFNGNSLSASERLSIKRKLLREGWYQNGSKKWEHPYYHDRREHMGFTLYGAAVKQGLIIQKGAR